MMIVDDYGNEVHINSFHPARSLGLYGYTHGTQTVSEIDSAKAAE